MLIRIVGIALLSVLLPACAGGMVPTKTVTVTATVTASPTAASLDHARKVLGPLLTAYDDAVARLNTDQNSESMEVRRAAARKLSATAEELAVALAAEDWPDRVAKEAQKLFEAISLQSDIAGTMADTDDPEVFRDTTFRALLPNGNEVTRWAGVLEIKLGLE